MSLNFVASDRPVHPVDVVEKLASLNDWSFDRSTEDEISIAVDGHWSKYQIAFTWIAEIEALHASTAFEFKGPDNRQQHLRELISLINEQLWIGHFDYWLKDNVIMFRHSLLLAGGSEPSSEQCEALMKVATEACERYYQAFQFVVWAGKSARESLDCAMFETRGNA